MPIVYYRRLVRRRFASKLVAEMFLWICVAFGLRLAKDRKKPRFDFLGSNSPDESNTEVCPSRTWKASGPKRL